MVLVDAGDGAVARVEQVEMLGGAPPRRPGRGGGRWWRRRGEGER